MYSCVNALLKKRGANSRTTSSIVNSAKIRTLIEENTIAVLILTHPAIAGKLSLDLYTVKDLVYGVLDTITVDQWLQTLGDKTLPTTLGELKPAAGVIKCNDLFVAGYNATKIHPRYSADSDLPEDELTNIRITKADVDYKLFYESCLISVNGLFHLTDYSTAGVTIIDGGRSVLHGNSHEISLLSFKDVGKVKCYPVTEDHIRKRGNLPLKNGFNIHMPEVDFANKVIMISLGGYLHFANHGYKMVGENTIKLEWYRLLFEERYFNSKDKIDLSDFERVLNRNANHGDALDMNQASTDAAILAYMQLSQTFVITIDTDNFYYERHALERTGLIGRWYSYERPDWPLQLENGLMPSYVAVPETEAYVVAIPDGYVRRYVGNTQPRVADVYYNEALISQYPGWEGNGYLIEMGTEYLK